MSPSTKFALLLALGIHAAVGFAVKLPPIPPPAKLAENYVEVALYDPPPPSNPAPPVVEPPPPEPPLPEPPPTPIVPEMAPEPAPIEPKQEPAPVIPEPEPKPVPKPVAKPVQKVEPANPKSTATRQPAANPNPKSTNPTGGGNSYQAVNSVSFLNRRTPAYPPDALRNKQTGRVVLLLYINEFGTVDRVEMVSSSGIPSLDAAATSAAKKSTFRPAVSGGRPAKSKAKVPFNFQIKP